MEIDLRSKIGNRIYGCDDCLAICPWNKFAKAGSETRLYAREELKMPDLKELVSLDDRAFRDKFSIDYYLQSDRAVANVSGNPLRTNQ